MIDALERAQVRTMVRQIQGTLGDGDHPAYATTVPLDGVLLDAADGTAAIPQTVPSPIIKGSRTGAVTQAAIEANASVGTDGAEQMATILGISYGTAAEETQGVGVCGIATTGATNGNWNAAGCGVYGVGYALADSEAPALGIGGFFAGRRDSAAAQVTGVEVVCRNQTGQDGILAVGGASDTKGIWINANGLANSAVGIQFGNGFGRQFLYGIHFNAQVTGGKTGGISLASFRDDSLAATSIWVQGTHATAAIAVKAGSGSVILGAGATPALQNATAIFEVQAPASSGIIAAFGSNTNGNAYRLRMGNSSGTADWFVSGGANNILTGTASGDTGHAISTAGKAYHLGGTASVIKVTQANQLAFFAGAGAGQQTVTGSRGGNAALASLITALAAHNLIVDGTSA